VVDLIAADEEAPDPEPQPETVAIAKAAVAQIAIQTALPRRDLCSLFDISLLLAAVEDM
jgi:hypothetical protein